MNATQTAIQRRISEKRANPNRTAVNNAVKALGRSMRAKHGQFIELEYDRTAFERTGSVQCTVYAPISNTCDEMQVAERVTLSI